MQIGKNELLAMLETYRSLELENARRCQEKEEDLRSIGAKLILNQLRMDSEKHARVFQTLISMIEEGIPAYLWDYKIDRYVGRLAITQILEEYLEAEKDIAKGCKNLIRRMNDPGLQMILQQVVVDEKIHKTLLEDIARRLYKLGPMDIPETPPYEREKPQIRAIPRPLMARLSYCLNSTPER